MTPTPIALLQQAADCGLRLGFEPPDTLTVEPARLCSPELVAVLKAHKPQLLELLRLPFCMVYSRTVEENVFFCEDEVTKAALVEGGEKKAASTHAQSYKSLSSMIARVRSSLMNCSGCIKPNALSIRGSPNETCNNHSCFQSQCRRRNALTHLPAHCCTSPDESRAFGATRTSADARNANRLPLVSAD